MFYKKTIFLYIITVFVTLYSIKTDSFALLPGSLLIDSLFTDSVNNHVQDSLDRVKYLAQGKTLYENTCNKCHSLYEPEDFTLKIWKKNLKEMRIKAGLKEDEYKNILEYLSANCKK